MQEKLKMMRIIAGKYRHKNIIWPLDKNIRPTKDRIREALFSILGDISNKTFLDVYSGSGAISLEAISRGAKVVMNDKNINAIKCIKENIKRVNLDEEDEYELNFLEDVVLLEKLAKEEKVFDIVFLDPPYLYPNTLNIIKYIKEKGIVKNSGFIVIESDQKFTFDEEKYQKVKIYKYGEINLYLLKA